MPNSGRQSLQKKNDLMRSAIDLHRSGQPDQAKSIYLHILKLNPLDVDTLHLLGVVELQEKNWSNAAKYISQSLALNPNQPGALNNYGIALKELNDFDAAIEQYLKAIKLQPQDANAHMNLGNAYQAKGKYEAAIQAYDTSIILNPSLTAAIVNRAFALSRQGNHINAVFNYKLALRINPDDPNIYNNLGNSLSHLNEKDLALRCYSTAIDLNPSNGDAYFNKGNNLRDLGKMEEALLCYNKAIEINSNNVDQFINRGNVLRDLALSSEAIESFNAAIKMSPGYAHAYNNRGNAALDLGQVELALEDYSLAIALDPAYAQAYNNRGNVFRLLFNIERAKENYQRATYLDSIFPDAYNNIGVVLMESFLTLASVQSFDRAIELNPSFTDAYFNKANALRDLKLFKQSILEYKKALAIKPDYEYLRGLLLHSQMQICDWDGIHENTTALVASINREQRCSPPFPVLGLVDSPELQLKAATLWAQTKFPSSTDTFTLTNPFTSGDKGLIRIGYFSSDFRDHPVSYLMADLFEHHDRSRFEIIAFSLGPNKRDVMRERLERSFDIWVESFGQSDDAVVRRARELQIDIAVDLGGFTKNSRTGIFARRVAPVQVSYIGYLGTMGAPYIDYLLADEIVISKESRPFYSERIAYLPIYQANDSKREMSIKQISRSDLGLPQNAFIYCCFNTNYKLTPTVFASWMRILLAVKDSVLLIYADTQEVKSNLRFEAARHFINPNRIYFAERVDRPEYLRRYALADLFLDTSPYNAGTTASDALWSGLPVLTLMGKSFASRMASSLLIALGMQELITYSGAQYEALAIELGQSPHKMHLIREKLKLQKESSALFNTQKFTANLERVFAEMVRRTWAGEPLSDIEHTA